ncbi:hypothetical protein AB0I10_12550 [Streptomyces sp. NPDC050636]|uniref:hypothetical protein n=1 Tax=Streptomyces sp. NPDC050636 TaxID=3154510 RepID=UPI00341517AC
MTLTDDDLQMAVHDFLTPALLLEFIDLPSLQDRAAWGRRQFADGARRMSALRLPGEPDAGCRARWAESPGGFRYEIQTPAATRAGELPWSAVHSITQTRLTAVRYGALHQAVTQEQAHDAEYVTCPLPYRTPELWQELFYASWTTRAATLSLRSAAAYNAILPPAVAQPALF